MAQEYIPNSAFTSTSDPIQLRPGMQFSASVVGDGALEGKDASGAWVAYPDSGPLFGGWAPANGIVRVAVNSGTVNVELQASIEKDA